MTILVQETQKALILKVRRKGGAGPGIEAWGLPLPPPPLNPRKASNHYFPCRSFEQVAISNALPQVSVTLPLPETGCLNNSVVLWGCA